MSYNSKERSTAMQTYAMKHVKIRPMSDEVNQLIQDKLVELGLPEKGNRTLAFQILQQAGLLQNKDVGGEILNQEDVLTNMVKEFGCVRQTARRHVARAARRQRWPDYKPPQRGGVRPGAGAKRGSE